MSEAPLATPVEPVAPAATVEPTTTEVVTPEPDAAAEAAKWKAMARKHEAEAKANADKARKFDEAQAASLTEIEKAQKAAAESDSKAAALEAKLAIAQAAITHGLDADDLEALEGVPADKVEAIAARLAAKKAAVPTVPSAIGQGNVGDPIGSTLPQLTEAQLSSMTPEQVNEARRAGRLDQLMGKTH